jgi:hypothetical protein
MGDYCGTNQRDEKYSQKFGWEARRKEGKIEFFLLG